MALDPTHIAATTSAIATVIFSKALEKGGEHIGDVVYQRMGEFITSVKVKFQQRGQIDILTEVQDNPSEQNISQFTQELMDLMLEDGEFAADVENSLRVFSEDSEMQKIIGKESLNLDFPIPQPLTVAHFKEDEILTEQQGKKKSLKVEDALNLDEKNPA